MSTPTLDDLTQPLTLDEVRASVYATLSTIGVNTTTWKPGAVLRTVITACCLILAAFSRLIALIARSGFVDLSSGVWLTIAGFYSRGVPRITATFASGNLAVSNSGGGVYGPFAAGAITFASAVSGKNYKNTASFSIGAMQTGVVVPVQAVEMGAASTANAGDISVVVTNLLGVSCTNPTALVGTDDEKDDAYKARCASFLGSLSPNGPRDAYSYVARTAGRDAGGNPILITATTPGASLGINHAVTIKDGLGGVDVYVSTPSGPVTGSIGDLTTDLGAVEDLIQRLVVPLTVTARVQSAIAVPIAVTYEIWLYQTSLQDADITAAISSALAGFIPQRPIGGDVIAGVGAVWQSAIEAVIGSATAAGSQPLGIFRVNVIAPAGDTILAPTQVPVLGAVTAAAIHRVPRTGT